MAACPDRRMFRACRKRLTVDTIGEGAKKGYRGPSVLAKTPGVTPTYRVNATLNALAEA